MTTADAPAARAATPWWFWTAAGVSLLWNAFGGYDYTMSHLQGEAYYRASGMTQAQIAILNAYPAWMHAVWATGVWGSVLGSVLLLARSRWAFHSFAASALGAIGSLAYSQLAVTGESPVFPTIIAAICLALVWFSQAMTKRGLLR